jgi:dihydroflavonol-4-reductase
MTRPALALVTGVSGFVGNNLARLLLEKGYEVRGLVRPQSDRTHLPKHPQFRAIEGDLRELSGVLNAVKECHEIYHVAADYRFWSRDWNDIYQSNVQGTKNLFHSAEKAGTKTIVYTSTVGTMGLSKQPHPCDENSHPLFDQFSTHYKKSKLKAETIAIQYAQAGLPIVIVNPSTPIGPGDSKPTPTGKMILDMINGKMPAYVHTGLNFIHVRDVAEGHLLAAKKGRIGQRYILGNQNITLHHFFEMVAKELQKLVDGATRQAPRIRIPYSVAYIAGLVSTKYADWISKKPPSIPLEAVKTSKNFMFFEPSKAIHELGLPQTPVTLAIQDAIQWYLENNYFPKMRLSDKRGKIHVHPI